MTETMEAPSKVEPKITDIRIEKNTASILGGIDRQLKDGKIDNARAAELQRGVRQTSQLLGGKELEVSDVEPYLSSLGRLIEITADRKPGGPHEDAVATDARAWNFPKPDSANTEGKKS